MEIRRSTGWPFPLALHARDGLLSLRLSPDRWGPGAFERLKLVDTGFFILGED